MSLQAIGGQFSSYIATAVERGDPRAVDPSKPSEHFVTVPGDDHMRAGRVILLRARDSETLAQPNTAIFGELNDELTARDGRARGAFGDSEYVQFYWRTDHDDLKKTPSAILSGFNRRLRRIEHAAVWKKVVTVMILIGSAAQWD